MGVMVLVLGSQKGVSGALIAPIHPQFLTKFPFFGFSILFSSSQKKTKSLGVAIVDSIISSVVSIQIQWSQYMISSLLLCSSLSRNSYRHFRQSLKISL